MTHVTDGDLVRLLDGEVDVAEQLELESHVDSCEECAGRYFELRRNVATVRSTIRRADVAVPRSGLRTWGLRAAAVLLALTAVGLTVRPTRAWIVERTRALWAAVAGDEATQPDAAAGPAPVVALDPTAAVSFVPAGDVFVIELSSRQAAGRLTVRTVAGETATATVYGGTQDERLIVLPGGLRIVNQAAAQADYAVELPANLLRLLVVIGNEDTLRYEPDPSGAAGRWDIDLSSGARGQ